MGCRSVNYKLMLYNEVSPDMVYGIFILSFILCGATWAFLAIKTKIRQDRIAGISVSLISLPPSIVMLLDAITTHKGDYLLYLISISPPILIFVLIPPFWRYSLPQNTERAKRMQELGQRLRKQK